MLNDMSKVKKFDYCAACTFYLGAIIVVLVCQALVGVVAAALGGVVPNISENGDLATAFMIIIQLANLAFILVYCKLNKYRFGCDLAAPRANGKTVALDLVLPILCAGLLMAAMYLPTLWYGYFTRYALGIPPDYGSIDLSTPSSVVMIVIASVILAPVCEESIYRGVLCCGLKRECSAVKTVLLSALAFMLMHMSPVQVVFQFALGAVGACIMLRSGRLLPCVLLHAAANSLALIIQLTPLSAALDGSVAWLTQNVAAAFFITLGLLVCGGAGLFAAIRFGFKGELPAADGDAVNTAGMRMTAEDAALVIKREGTKRYIIATVISGIMFIVNLITMVVS